MPIFLRFNQDASLSNFSTIEQCTAELLMIQHIFPPVFFRGSRESQVLRVRWTVLYQIWGGEGLIRVTIHRRSKPTL